MADRNHPNTAEPVDLPDNDPFAELTRIMGFDPRQPAKPAAPVENQEFSASGIAEDAGDDDFGIDLEKEMMGGFEAGEDDSAAPTLRSEQPELDDADFGDVELDLAADFDDEMSAPEVVVAPEIAAVDDAEIEFDLDDEAFLAAVEEDEIAAPEMAAPEMAAPEIAAPEMVAVEAAEAELDLQGEFVHAPAIEADHAPAMDAAGAPAIHMDLGGETDFSAADSVGDIEPGLAADFDSEPSPSLATDSELDADWTDTLAADVDSEPEPFAAAPEPVAEVDMAAGFDAALLDAGIDDELDAVALEEENQQDSEPGVAELPEETPQPEDEELHFSLEDFDVVDDEQVDAEALAVQAQRELTTDDPLESALPIFPSRPVEYRSADAVYVGPVEEEPLEAADNSLEDELNALLGNIAATAAAGSASAETRPEAAPDPALAFESIDSHAADPQAEPELEWDDADLLADAESEAVEDFQPQAASHESDLQDNFDNGVQAVDLSHLHGDRLDVALDDGRTGPDLVDVPDFDHDDLDAAIANAMSGSAPQPNDTQPVWRQPEPAPVPRQAGQREDPLDVIAALTAKYSAPVSAASFGRTDTAGRQAFGDAPDIETIEVQDRAVALADDLDLPELSYEEQPSPVSDYDDLDTEFSSLLNDLNASDAVVSEVAATPRSEDARGYWQRLDDAYAPAATDVSHETATHAAHDDEAQGEYSYDEAPRHGADTDDPEAEADVFGYDFDEAVAAPAVDGDRAPPRRGMMIAAIVGGVALVGGLGAFAMSFGGGSGDDVPVLVRADDTPIKIKPANPGGTTVPNQDNKVYDTVAGTGSTDDPQQERLVTTAEEPVDMTPPAPEPELVDLAPVEGEGDPLVEGEGDPLVEGEGDPLVGGEGDPAPKGEDRIEQILQEAEADLDTRVAAIEPRKVRTMVVKADGTLVPREDPAPVEVVEPQAAAAIEALAEPAAAAPSAPEALAGTQNFTPPAGEAAAGLAPVPGETPARPAPVEVQSAQQATFPDTVPIAPTRPSEQPVDVVGEVKPDQVAALSPTTANAAGSWSMQIASQPSEAAAQSSYQDLLSRYGSVLNGRQANIVKAEIAGKGTFWRVRVPAQTRNDAIDLCESYKTAGGNCFVSR